MVEDEAAFVDLVGVDALLGVEVEVAIAGGDAEEGDDAFGFEDAEAVGHLAIDIDVLDERDAEVAGFDVGVV